MTETDTGLHALQQAARIFSEMTAAGEAIDVVDQLSRVPVPTRLVLAAAVLAAADKPVSTVNLCAVAGVSRGSAYNHHKDQMNAIRQHVPVLVRAQLGMLGATTQTAELYEQLRDRERSIERLRAEVRALKSERDTALAYARDLHERLRPELEAIEQEQAAKVRPLRIIADPTSEETDHSTI
jgi:hypothetical protein